MAASTSIPNPPPSPPPLRPVWEPLGWLPFGASRPGGWLAERMRRDLAGFVGNLDRLAPDLIVEDQIYGRDRLSPGTGPKQLGALTDDDQPAQFMWWNSETQSNWRDGWVRHILLVGDAAQRAAVRAWVDAMVATADPDGYLGIATGELRYPATGENGELWAKASLGRALLGYHEAAEDREHARAVLAVIVAMASETMTQLPIGKGVPFAPGGYAGVAHGLAVTDVFARLGELTGDEEFTQYGRWLYQAYSVAQVSEPDVQLPALSDPTGSFVGHGVHTYEHLRSLVLAATTDREARAALSTYLFRLGQVLTPAGGPIGDEWIHGRSADATTTGYEFCSIQELVDSLLHLMAATGDVAWADLAEHVVFNAGFGAWHPQRSAIAYLQTDNCLQMTGPGPVPGAIGPKAKKVAQTRYRYSPLHRQAAVCCVPNAGRLLPTYLRGAVMVRPGPDPESGRVVVGLYGPMTTQVLVAGQPVTIEQDTRYPWPESGGSPESGWRVRLDVRSPGPVGFELVLRRPAWAQMMLVDGREISPSQDALPGADGEVVIPVGGQRHLDVEFRAQPRIHVDGSGDGYVTWGPLVLALPIPDATTTTHDYGFGGFADLALVPVDEGHRDLRLRAGERPRAVPGRVAVAACFERSGTAEEVTLELVPMAEAPLRRVTFPLA